jgi:hypothetical protein
MLQPMRLPESQSISQFFSSLTTAFFQIRFRFKKNGGKCTVNPEDSQAAKPHKHPITPLSQKNFYFF